MRMAVENDILYHTELLLGYVVVGHFCGRVDDGEIHTSLYGMVQEHGVHGLADVIVAPE